MSESEKPLLQLLMGASYKIPKDPYGGSSTPGVTLEFDTPYSAERFIMFLASFQADNCDRALIEQYKSLSEEARQAINAAAAVRDRLPVSVRRALDREAFNLLAKAVK
jgi:hypothetical protein